MEYYKYLIWIPQFGIAIASPIAIFILLAVWLRNTFDLGSWILFLGIVLGIYTAYLGAKDTVRAMELLGKKDSKKDTAVYFNQHS